MTYIVLVLLVARMRSIASLLVTAGAMSILIVTAFGYAAGHANAIKAFAVQNMNQIGGGEHSVYRWLFYYSPYGRVFEFILGCLTAQIYAVVVDRPVSPREERWGRILLGASLVFLFGFACVQLFRPFGANVATVSYTHLDVYKRQGLHPVSWDRLVPAANSHSHICAVAIR